MKMIIEESSVPEPNSGCWIWVGHSRKGTYGDVRINGRYIMAHRLSYEAYKGEIPEGKIICHSCGNPSCVNPEHLYAGTHKQNANDRKTHGTHLEGESHPMYGKRGKESPNFGRKVSEETKKKISEALKGNSNGSKGRKYTEEDVRDARQAFEQGYTQSMISKLLGIPLPTIHQMVRRKGPYVS